MLEAHQPAELNDIREQKSAVKVAFFNNLSDYWAYEIV